MKPLAGLVLLGLWTSLSSPAMAFSLEERQGPLPGMRAPPPGVTSWDLLGKASVLPGAADDGARYATVMPPEVAVLDGQEVKLMGFMFQTEPEAAAMRRFLLVEYPVHCPFCLAAATEPSRVVEVHTPDGIGYREDQVVVSGCLEIVNDGEDGLVYRLRDAQLSE